MVEMIEPYKGRVYDPCCGSGGMFIMSEKFVEATKEKLMIFLFTDKKAIRQPIAYVG